MRSHTLKLLLPAAAATVALALPVTALAGTPVQVGAGGEPEVAVTPDGRAHVAFHVTGTPSARTLYCQVPRGTTGTACVSGETFPAPTGKGLFDRPHVLLTDIADQVAVLRRTCCGPNTTTFTGSIDGGQTFNPETTMASDGDSGVSPVDLGGDAIFAGGTVAWVNNGLAFQAWSGGATVTRAASRSAVGCAGARWP